MHQFKLPIGDWSDDGHGKCDYFVVESNVLLKDIIPIYINMDKEYKLSDVCAEYEENQMEENFIKFLNELGLPSSGYADDTRCMTSESMAYLIIDLLMKFDPSLKLQIVPEEKMPMLNNWEAQAVTGERGGVLSLPGYGLFYD